MRGPMRAMNYQRCPEPSLRIKASPGIFKGSASAKIQPSRSPAFLHRELLCSVQLSLLLLCFMAAYTANILLRMGVNKSVDGKIYLGIVVQVTLNCNVQAGKLHRLFLSGLCGLCKQLSVIGQRSFLKEEGQLRKQ